MFSISAVKRILWFFGRIAAKKAIIDEETRIAYIKLDATFWNKVIFRY